MELFFLAFNLEFELAVLCLKLFHHPIHWYFVWGVFFRCFWVFQFVAPSLAIFYSRGVTSCVSPISFRLALFFPLFAIFLQLLTLFAIQYNFLGYNSTTLAPGERNILIMEWSKKRLGVREDRYHILYYSSGIPWIAPFQWNNWTCRQSRKR